MDGDTNTESEDQASGPVAVSFASLDALFLDTNFGELQNITGPNVMDQHTSHQSRRGDKNNVPSSSVISPLASATSGAISLVANPLSLPPSQVSSIGSHAIQSQASASAIAMQTATLGSSNSIPEFLYQLTKMLTDDNRDIIEWTKGKIEVHNPYKLESQVLHKYFRHSKFASFQRQLNYFGFRKLAGKGKMAPCSYVNEAARGDIASLLLIKRKSSTPTMPKESSAKETPSRSKTRSASSRRASSMGSVEVNPALVSILHKQTASQQVSKQSPAASAGASMGTASTSGIKEGSSHVALAKAAVGKGIRHSFTVSSVAKAQPRSDADVQRTESAQRSSVSSSNLAQLEDAYQSSLNDVGYDKLEDPTPLSEMCQDGSATEPFFGFLSRNSSLVDLAMIPGVEAESPSKARDSSQSGESLSFIDFPTDVADQNDDDHAGP